jgi:hypothetical protein
MSSKQWGPAVWNLFHTLAAKINENDYNLIGIELFLQIKRICDMLPCPDCSQHAKRQLNAVNIDALKTKYDLINVLFIFHNNVNIRTKKQLYNFDDLINYKSMNLISVLNAFILNYKTHGNMQLLSDSFQRKLIIESFTKWIRQNFKSFMS